MIEFSSPLHSSARAREGSFLVKSGINPYERSYIRMNPSIILLFQILPVGGDADFLIGFFFSILSYFIFTFITKHIFSSIKRKTANTKLSILQELMQRHGAKIANLAYLFNPYTIVSSATKCTYFINSTVIFSSILAALKGKELLALILSGIATSLDPYLFMLFAPITLTAHVYARRHKKREQNKKNNVKNKKIKGIVINLTRAAIISYTSCIIFTSASLLLINYTIQNNRQYNSEYIDQSNPNEQSQYKQQFIDSYISLALSYIHSMLYGIGADVRPSPSHLWYLRSLQSQKAADSPSADGRKSLSLDVEKLSVIVNGSINQQNIQSLRPSFQISSLFTGNLLTRIACYYVPLSLMIPLLIKYYTRPICFIYTYLNIIEFFSPSATYSDYSIIIALFFALTGAGIAEGKEKEEVRLDEDDNEKQQKLNKKYTKHSNIYRSSTPRYALYSPYSYIFVTILFFIILFILMMHTFSFRIMVLDFNMGNVNIEFLLHNTVVAFVRILVMGIVTSST